MNASERIKRNKFSKEDNQLNKTQDYFSESYISELNNDIGSLESWKSTDELGQLRKKFSTVMLDLYRANDTSEQAQKLYNSVKSARDYLDNVSNEYSKYASADEYNAQMKLYEDQQKHYENLANSSEATFGWEKYLADLEASKQAENAEKEDEKWYEAIGRYLYGSGGSGTADSTLPTSNVSVAVGALREDDSYKKPQDNWSEEQKQVFGALYMSNPEEAYQYAIYTNNLNNKAAEAEKIKKIQESATSSFGAGLGHTLGSIATAPSGLADYLNDLAHANAGRPISSDGIVSPFEYSQGVTGGISSHLNTEYGTIDENIPIFGGKGLGDIYGLGTSVAQSMASAYTLGGIGTLVSYFGQGAASGVDDALSRGASDEQALLYGTALGVFEGLAEQIGVDNLFKLGSSSTVKGFIKNILKQAGAEGTEEGLTSLLSNIADNVIMQDKSNFNALVEKYMSKGMSETDAKTKAWLDLVSGIAFDTIAGAASGGISGTIHTTAQNIYANKQATQLYGDSTADLVSVVLDLDPNNKYAQKMKTILDSGKKLSGGQINRLLDETNAIIRNSAKVEETSDDSQANTTDTDSVESPSPTPQNTAQETETTTTAENTTAEENATESEFKASEDVSENETVDNAATLEEASKKYGAQAQAMIHTYNKGQDVYKYDSAYKTAYDMGKSGVSLSYAKNSKSTAYLTDSQKDLAYEAGKSAADATAKEQDAKNKSLANGKIGRKKGTVKGEGVTISDLRKSFNDTQNKAYKILSTYAEVTGIDIVLYKSETDEDGNFIGSQGKFKWKEDTIYIDINAGLTNIKDVNDLAKYTMLRTFSHEFTHFIEKWNPIWYNEFRKVVFDTLTERGENVHDLIETKMSMSEEMTYDEASREVVAEAMTDILPDANFVETLATNHKNIFDKLLDKLKEFLKDLKEYFKAIGDNSSREAKALKNEIDGAVHYVDNIVKLFDKVALEAVENYQKTVAIEEKTEKIDSTVTNNDENISKSAEKVQTTEQVTPAKEDIAENATPTKEATPEVDKTVDTVGDDTVQEQSRNYLDEDNTNSYSKSRKIPPLDEFSTYAMQWAYSDKTNIGEQKLFYRKGKWVLLEKSADGFVEMGAYAAENYDFIQKEIIKHNEKLHDSGINERVYRSALRYESLGSDNSRNIRNDVGQQTGNGRIGGLYQAESVSNRSADNEESKSNNEDLLSRSDSYEQNQQRTNTLTDREVLEIAAEDLMNEKIKVNGEMVDALSQAEKDALTIFQNRLSKLKDLQAERTEQGRLYKEQQFGEKVDRAKATETLNRMHILDERIKKATAEVLTVEEKEILKRVLKKARKVVETQERQHGQEILKRWRERRDNAVNIKKYKDRILSDREELIKWLKHPLEKNVTKHINDNVKDSVINFLISIDTTSARKLRKGVETKEDLKHDREAQDLLMILSNLDDEVRYSGDYDLPLNFTSRLETHIKTVRKLTDGYNGNMVLNRMSVEELRDLSIIIANLKTALTTMNKFHANAMFAHVTEAGDNTVSYLKELRKSNGNGFENFVMWKSIRPAEVWKRFGKGGISIERALRKGQDKLGLNAKVIIDFAKNTFTAKERKSWDTSAVNVTLSDGRNIKLTVSALMSFYELSKRKQGRDHILNGGVTVADVEIREDKKKQRINGRYGRFTEADIDIMNSKLTDRQKEVADKLQQFMEKQGGEWGNYVTLARFGEKAFGEVGYFPISVDKLSLSTQNTDKDIKGADLYRLLNMGFTKELSHNKTQPIMLYSIFDVFPTHMADMAQYNAMALPVLDAIRWLNYKTFDYDTKAETSNLRAELNRAYGSPINGTGYAESFIVHILKAYNSSEAHSTPEDALGIKFMHNYNRAQVAFNLRVVVQQPMSITRAALIINPKYITKALNAKKIKANIEDMLEHSGIAVWKDLGYYDINISHGLSQMIKQDYTLLDKVTDIGMKPAELMDKATWGVIWYACKLQLADQGITDYAKIEELFDEVIYRTQVVDSVLTKSQYMRDTGFFARASSAFMSESVTVASSVLSAYDDFQTEIRKGSSIGKAFGTHKKAIVKTMLVCSVSAIMLSVVQAVADALRDDDDYEKLYEKWLEAFKSNLIDEFSPLNKLPLFKYIEDIIEVGLDIFTDLDVYGKLSESAIAQWFDTLTKALEITKERLDGNSNYTLYAMIYKYFQVLSGISGIPASAAMREVVTIWNNTFAALLYPKLKVTTYEPSDMSQIRYAYEDGYLTADEAVKEMFSLTSKGYSEENIRSQAKSQIGEWYSNDEISKQQTVNMLDRYFDMESDEIDANISYWDFKNDNPDIDVNIGWFEKYYSDIADSGISIDEYVDYRNKVKDITGEDKKSKRMKIINSLPISKSQKDALYLAEGWSESKLYEAPWH